MSPDPLKRPNPLQRPNSRKNIERPRQDRANNNGGSGRGNNGGNGGGNNDEPSPWLDSDNEPSPDSTASFVEYLRWMRAPDSEYSDYKDGTKVQILQMATENANYRDRLKQLTKRTEAIAQITFQVKCPWRIRVGGHKGPENILLPAFDALGMPYIPSSTLRGVARTQAIRDRIAKQEIIWNEADKAVAPYFGSLEVEEKEKHNRAGKVVFLDAYPLPSQAGGLAMDMANNIWKWEDNQPEYAPNPNPFLSLKEPTFLIGLRLASNCTDTTVLEQVKEWLIAGLQSGIGSQVNTGYGELFRAGVGHPTQEFFRVEFALEGQLIHGHQKFTQWQRNERRDKWQMRGLADAEVRPVAFKSMLRYWFRAFTLGVLETAQEQRWEAKLFGGINPDKEYGYLKVGILSGKVTQKEPRPNYQGKDDPCGEQEGTLVLSLSPETPFDKQEAVKMLCKQLTWLMFNLGGIGQGARRPCYSRQDRGAPWYRGSTFYLDSDDNFWALPNTIKEFQKQFQQRLVDFYQALAQVTGNAIDYHHRREAGRVSEDNWIDAVDRNCEIVICAGKAKNNKPYALSVLHSPDLKKPTRSGRIDYDGNLCGQVLGKVKPSPVWIADLGDYQVVTVFGATENPRQTYLEELRSRASMRTSRQNYAKIFPLP
jgi:CRISPR-associated protein Cmr6